MTMLHWSEGEARVKAFSVSSRGSTSVIKVEIDVSTADALSWIVRQLHEDREAGKAPKARKKTAPTAPLALSDDTIRALPAPLLALEDRTSR